MQAIVAKCILLLVFIILLYIIRLILDLILRVQKNVIQTMQIIV